MTTTVCELYLNFLKQVKEKQFSRTIKGKRRVLSRLILPSVSKSPLARVKRDPRFCGVPSTSLTGAPLLALASVEPISARPTCLFTTRISKASTPSLPHCPHCTYHLLFISLQNWVLFYLTCPRTVPTLQQVLNKLLLNEYTWKKSLHRNLH